MHIQDAPVIVERIATSHGELVLRRSGEHFEIISNGVFLMDTRNGESERLLVSAALDECAASGRARVLIGGLGVGFSAAEAAVDQRAGSITVAEREPAVIAWHSSHLAPFSRGALHDSRISVECADLLEWLLKTPDVYDVICLDIDNGPDWTVTEGNAALYGDDGLHLLASRMRPGSVLSVWSAHASPEFESRLNRHFPQVITHTASVARGEPDIVYIATSACPSV